MEITKNSNFQQQFHKYSSYYEDHGCIKDEEHVVRQINESQLLAKSLKMEAEHFAELDLGERGRFLLWSRNRWLIRRIISKFNHEKSIKNTLNAFLQTKVKKFLHRSS